MIFKKFENSWNFKKLKIIKIENVMKINKIKNSWNVKELTFYEI